MQVLAFAGTKGNKPTADVSIFNTDTMKWFTPQLKTSATDGPVPRTAHACTSIREKVFVFGGLAADGTLLNDVWIFDQESDRWQSVSCLGVIPSARQGEKV